MRPRRVGLGCIGTKRYIRAVVTGFNEAEARRPRMRRHEDDGCPDATGFNEAEARRPRMLPVRLPGDPERNWLQ